MFSACGASFFDCLVLLTCAAPLLCLLTCLQGGEKWRKSLGGRAGIEAGDSGIFVTCDMGKEGKCIAEALDLFSQVRVHSYPMHEVRQSMSADLVRLLVCRCR